VIPETGFEVICFDADSTLSRLEGVDELARRAGVGEATYALTQQAMEGRLDIEEVFEKRLKRIAPSRSDLDWLGARYVETLVEGASRTLRILCDLGKEVHVISGGLKQAVIVLAERCGVAAERVHAVPLIFDAQGAYQDFDRDSPLWRKGGKAEICRRILDGRSKSMAMVGDGATDLEAKDAGATVIGFGGVAVREVVRREAAAFVDSSCLDAVLPFLLTRSETLSVE